MKKYFLVKHTVFIVFLFILFFPCTVNADSNEDDAMNFLQQEESVSIDIGDDINKNGEFDNNCKLENNVLIDVNDNTIDNSNISSFNEENTAYETQNLTEVDNVMEVGTKDNCDESNVALGATSEKVFYLGDSGDEIKELQYLLKKYGYLSDGYLEGTYDKITETAVKIFQMYHDIGVDGICGNKTKSALKLAKPFKEINYNEKSNAVYVTQTLLKNKGFLIVDPDGWWGAKSLQGVKLLNYYKGNIDNDNIEVPTLSILYDLFSDDKIKINNISGYHVVGEKANDNIKKIRLRLFLAGFFELTNSNQFDEKLEKAVKAYQNYGLVKADGIVGNWTTMHLNDMDILFLPIKFGQKGQLVKLIQLKLTSLGFMNLKADGIFGYGTEAAVIDFQKNNGLNQNGILQRNDFIDLVNKKNDGEILKKGDSGNEIIDIQQALFSLGYLINGYETGKFDTFTEKAVKVFQIYHGISPDGMVGAKTKRALKKANPFYVIEEGDRGDNVKEIQDLLYKKGFLIVKPDGTWGAKSSEGIKLVNYYLKTEYSGVPTINVIYDLLDQSGARINDISGYHVLNEAPNSMIKKVRLRLYLAGFMELNNSNIFDAKLQDVIKLYQLYGLINADGIIGNWTSSHLNSMDIFYKNIALGQSGNIVRQLQECLLKVGCLTVTADGSFGNKTVGAVKELQSKNNLIASGLMDHSAWISLIKMMERADNYILKVGNLYQFGMSGDNILFLQKELVRLGFANYVPDGYFGKLTRGSVALFQAYNGMSADGMCGTKTISQLISQNTKLFTPILQGENGRFIKVLQNKLKEMGLLGANADGIYGVLTARAIKTFQQQEALEKSGNLDLNTAVRLFSKVATMQRGIDVSEFQGIIDWNKVKAAGIYFAFIRVGGRYYGSGGMYNDSNFEINIKGAIAAGIKVGVYYFTQAININEAIEEANYTLNKIKKYSVSLPVVIDTEKTDNGRHNKISISTRTSVVKAFCDHIQFAGYVPMIYASTSWLNDNLNMSQLSDYKVWVADWNDRVTYEGAYSYWQYTSSGTLNGIKGHVDMDIGYLYD